MQPMLAASLYLVDELVCHAIVVHPVLYRYPFFSVAHFIAIFHAMHVITNDEAMPLF